MIRKINPFYFVIIFLFVFNSPGIAQTPYGGKVRTIPGLIEAEDFDLGGEGVGYHDRSTKNPGGGYRPDEGVGIKGMVEIPGRAAWYKSNESTPTVGWFFVGEWLKYTVDVTPGVYDISIRTATPIDDKAFNIYLDDKVIAYIKVPNSGQYVNWVTTTIKNIKIEKTGRSILKIQAGGKDVDECDINWIEFITSK